MEETVEKKFSVNVTLAEDITGDIRRITFKVNKPFIFIPGQYIWVEIQNLKVQDPKGNRRAFSICNTVSDDNTISIIARKGGSGFKQSLFALKIDDEVYIHGPFGTLQFPQNTDAPVICIAGGVGIAPFLSLIPDSLAKTSQRKIILIYANHSKEDATYLSFFQELQNKYSQFSLIEVTGKVTPEILSVEKTKCPSSNWMIIGPKVMVYFVAEILYAAGVKENEMIFEEFFWEKNTSQSVLLSQDAQKILGAFKLAMEQTSNHVIMTDINGYIIFANKSAGDITGYSFSEMQNQTPRLWGGLMTPEFYQNLWHTIKIEKKPFIAEIKNRRKNGELYDAITHISPFNDTKGNLIGFMGTEEDISILKKTSKNLDAANTNLENSNKAMLNVMEDLELSKTKVEQEKAKSDAIITNIGDGIISVDKEGKIIRINPAAYKMLDLSQEELIGKKLFESIIMVDETGKTVPQKDRPITSALAGTTTTTTGAVGLKYYYIKKDNTKFPVAITVSPVVLNGDIIGAIEVFRDVTRETEIDRMKTEFISLASHQLRTPLSAMKWFCEMLLNGDAGILNSDQKEYAQNISESNERMIDLVNSLLNVSRIESGRIIVDPVPTDISKLLSQIIMEIKTKTDQKKQQIIANIDQDIPLINIDPKLVGEVYANLLTNSSKYTPDGGKIQIFVSRKGDELVSQITDTGYGILEKDKDRVFSKFFRGENIIKLETDGTGLGLYLAKKIIESSGGKIWFSSKGGSAFGGELIEEHGTTFWFTLPMSGMQKKEGEVTLNA